MKLFILIATLVILSSCAATRVIVQDCKGAGDGVYNCELIKKL